MRCIHTAIALIASVSISNVFCQPVLDNQGVLIEKISNSELSVNTAGSERHCLIDQEIVAVKLSSDGQAVIISGTSFIPTVDLEHCKSDAVVRAREAAPHVGFLNDVNLKAGIYASMVPVSVNPMGFLAVVGRLGSDRNLVNRAGFYRAGIKQSILLSEASSLISPTLSLDARYISLNLHGCNLDVDDGVSVIEIHSGRQVKLSLAACEKMFHSQ